MDDEAFFRPDGDAYLPLPLARGPWNPQSLNGRVVAGLLGAVLDERHGRPGWLPARLTVDLYRLPGFDPVIVETSVVREGRRILVVDARFLSGGVDMARATCQFLIEGENAPGEVWHRAGWDVPAPDAVAAVEMPRKVWEFRPIAGAFGTAARRQGWMRELRPMIAGVPITPFARAAAACDFASPFAHSGSDGLGYINTDVTLALHRLPAGEWIGFESDGHEAHAGIAVGQCRLYDEAGPIGLATCLALAQKQALKPR